MEIYNVVGFRLVKFNDQKTNSLIEGYTLFLERTPDPEENIQGIECLKQFISSSYVRYVPQVGDSIRLIYNKYGKIGAIEAV